MKQNFTKEQMTCCRKVASDVLRTIMEKVGRNIYYRWGMQKENLADVINEILT